MQKTLGLIRSLEENLNRDLSNANLTEKQYKAAIRQIERTRKKFRVPDPSLSRTAIDDFLHYNDVAGRVSITADPYVLANARCFIERALERFTARYVDAPQCSLDLGLLFSLWRFGPGASRGTNRTHFADKITLESWTCTNRARPYVRTLRAMNPHLSRFDAEAGVAFKLVDVRGSKLSTVSKNDKTDRTIGTEPLGNMALQLAAGMYIEGALRSVGLDITCQEEKNKELAWKGSIDGTTCTIDLSHASDLITLALIRLVWPANWFHLLSVLRSEEIEINGVYHKLHMMSTMGNGFTFPMMTLTLLALIYGVRCLMNRQNSFKIDYSCTGVYGDDIIVKTDEYSLLCEVLSGCGLSVNNDKSFSTGSFRESCGGDYDAGVDVTPFYVKSLSCDPEVYVAINQLLLWSSKHRIPVPETLNWLRSLLREPELIVPEWEGAFAGIRLLSTPRRYRKLEYNKRLVNRRIRHPLDLMSILGGYVDSGGDNRVMFSPRAVGNRPKGFKIVHGSRLPKGYREGYDPLLGSYTNAQWRDQLYWSARDA